MKNSKFEYNKKNAVCSFCDRKKNPHPNFDEPLVVRNLKLNNKKLSICINCHYELLDKSSGNETIFGTILLVLLFSSLNRVIFSLMNSNCR